MTIKTILKVLAIAREQDRKVREHKALVGQPLNYPMLHDIANLASSQSITIRVGPLKDGSYIEMKSNRDTPNSRVGQKIAAESGVDWQALIRENLDRIGGG